MNEYWTLEPDCLLYRTDGFCNDHVSSIMIHDNLSEEMNVEDTLPVNAIFGKVLEVKSYTKLSKEINEFFNVFCWLQACLHCTVTKEDSC